VLWLIWTRGRQTIQDFFYVSHVIPISWLAPLHEIFTCLPAGDFRPEQRDGETRWRDEMARRNGEIYLGRLPRQMHILTMNKHRYASCAPPSLGLRRHDWKINVKTGPHDRINKPIRNGLAGRPSSIRGISSHHVWSDHIPESNMQ